MIKINKKKFMKKKKSKAIRCNSTLPQEIPNPWVTRNWDKMLG